MRKPKVEQTWDMAIVAELQTSRRHNTQPGATVSVAKLQLLFAVGLERGRFGLWLVFAPTTGLY